MLFTPCCQTEIDPGNGFQSVTCCGNEYSRERLEELADEGSERYDEIHDH